MKKHKKGSADAPGMSKREKKLFFHLFAPLYTHYRLARGVSAEAACALAGEEAIRALLEGQKNHWL